MAVKIRDYEVRLTRTQDERRLVRQLRYRCFVLENGFPATEEMKDLAEEWDDFDQHAEYMAVFHNGIIVGTYRIIDKEAAEKIGGFYTETEFDIARIKRRKGNMAEMSRACVDKEYRDNPLVLSMLWIGLGEYIQRKRIQILFGVAGWAGSVNPANHAHALSYMYYYHLAPMSLRVTPAHDKMDPSVNPKMTRMNILQKQFVDKDLAIRQMTPLQRGYLRLNAKFGKGTCIIPKENEIDVFVVCLTKDISKAYQKRFMGNENAFDSLGLRSTPMQMLGKLMMLPFKGMFITIKSVAGLFLTDKDLEDAEIIEDEDKLVGNGE